MHTSFLLEHKGHWTCNVICISCLWVGLTDKLTPWRCISRMHAMSQMSHVIDRTPHCLSKRSALSMHSQGKGGGGLLGQNAWSARGPLPLCPDWVMSWVLDGGAHVSPYDIWLTQSYQTLHWALSWTLGLSIEPLQLPPHACWHWMMFLFIMVDRCHVRHALRPCKVSRAVFTSQVKVLWTWNKCTRPKRTWLGKSMTD